MAKVKLSAGAEVDLLSPKEHEAHLAKLEQFLSERDGTTLVHAGSTFSTDASGNTAALAEGGGAVYRVPDGFHAYLLRLSIDFEGSNPSSPTTCGVKVCADYVTPSALRAANNTVPSVFSASRSHAPMFRQGQRVIVALQGGPATTMIYCTVQVLLVSTTGRLRTDVLES
jgi:hypothetical protein